MVTSIRPAATRLAIGVALLFAVGLAHARSGQSESVKISVNDIRPLAAAIFAFEDRFGWVVTYEEAAILYAGDTREARGSTGIRHVGPRGGPFTFVTSYTADTSPLSLLERLLQQYSAAGYPGQFDVQSAGTIFHVVLRKRKNARGDLEEYRPLLDAPVTIPKLQRSAGMTIDAILEEVGRTTGAELILGTAPLNLLGEARVEIGATNEAARSVLSRILQATGPVTATSAAPPKLSWALMCDPSPGPCGFNVYVVGKP
jgi:hypothetical protein